MRPCSPEQAGLRYRNCFTPRMGILWHALRRGSAFPSGEVPANG